MQGVVKLDVSLAAHEEHLKYRWRQFQATRAAIVQNEGSLEEFSKACGACGGGAGVE
jgi:hypothetical protein